MTTTKKTKTATSTTKAVKATALNRETSLAKINGNIALIRKNSNAFRDLVQKTLVMICRHGKEFGDVTAMARLMNDGLTNWHRRGPVCDYVADFTPIIVKFKGGVAVASLQEKDQRKPWNIDGMEATPFWEHKSLQKDNELPLDVDDIDTNVVKFADRLKKMLDDKKIAPSAIEHTKALIAGIKSVVTTNRPTPKEKPKPSEAGASEVPAAAAAGAAVA